MYAKVHAAFLDTLKQLCKDDPEFQLWLAGEIIKDWSDEQIIEYLAEAMKDPDFKRYIYQELELEIPTV